MSETTEKTKRVRAPRRDVFKYNSSDIVLDPTFPYNRTDLGDIESLAASILENGVQEPLIGYKNPENPTQVVVVHGFRRFHALNLAVERGFTGMAEFTLKNIRGYSTAQKHIDIAIANDSKEMSGLEKGMLFTNLENEGLNRKSIAAKLAVTQAHISDMVSLTIMPNPIQQAIMGGMISSSLALQIGKEHKTPEKQMEVFEAAKADMEANVADEVKEMASDSEKEEAKTTKKITAKNVTGISKSPLKTLEAALEADTLTESNREVLSRAYSLLKKKVSVEEFVEAFSVSA